ncbi:hypothetical protein [Actinoplanes couchii]|uniref:hypothetical protein n=1 Tax=Actinoplanes couchii TaxID=403638 RepID=UPI001944BE9A|nr:hypothetical protein [Actinoplanes couchii]MDR6323876.1 hypothetical protein [Actinoplanes couchii]
MSCGVAALLRPGGPVRVPLRDCCVAALLGVDGVTTTSTCLATAVEPSAPGSSVPGSPAAGVSAPGVSSPVEVDAVPVLVAPVPLREVSR